MKAYEITFKDGEGHTFIMHVAARSKQQAVKEFNTKIIDYYQIKQIKEVE